MYIFYRAYDVFFWVLIYKGKYILAKLIYTVQGIKRLDGNCGEGLAKLDAYTESNILMYI